MAAIPTMGSWLLDATSYGTLIGTTSVLLAAGWLVSMALPKTVDCQDDTDADGSDRDTERPVV
jgi:hypothetical protein